ncbi:MAG: threonylcarbamoyl-AMP synthase [Acidobacteria bacterium 21-70-11]|nr:MAG: threonylcarbamoyl-AMP synthase [Acidobacteria bacterium 21-70-11]OYW05442.1 MAG: threonylcarbamoyl-AMP synthase [Acidobacteria bacterium 37-71-11]HQT93377.1 L-threonylcarbamoyladenylate synthase [Thermoanaerobaculaceae bacterium]HQU33045.1 L-threonylcarbamoyladenylate synthase [Thermoanaerobaculaceae bacterium]
MNRLPFTAESHLTGAADGARAALAGGGIVALPTETFYGLAVRPDDETAVRRVFALKGRPAEQALLVVAASVAQLEPWVRIPSRWRERLEAVWPAPVTVVLARAGAAAAGAATLAVRVPAHPLLRKLLAEVGPLTATSANASGAPPCARSDDVVRSLGHGLALLLDGGDTPGGAATTLLDLTADPPLVLRAGAWRPPESWGVKAV